MKIRGAEIVTVVGKHGLIYVMSPDIYGLFLAFQEADGVDEDEVGRAIDLIHKMETENAARAHKCI